MLCCADEAALCWGCDEKVHAANKLAGKHQRVPLLPQANSTSSPLPTCDICQEKAGYFFCLEDRALLCRQCDVAIHTASPYVSSHQRFLITGVRVALQHYLTNSSANNRSSSNGNSSSSNTNSKNPTLSPLASNASLPNRKLQIAPTGLAVEEVEVEGSRPPWPWNEILDGVELDHCYGLSGPRSSS